MPMPMFTLAVLTGLGTKEEDRDDDIKLGGKYGQGGYIYSKYYHVHTSNPQRINKNIIFL